MLCLPRPLAAVPDGEWLCPVCDPPPPPWKPEDEHGLELQVGTSLWAKDKRGLWGEAIVQTAEEAGGAVARVGLRWKGFAAKYLGLKGEETLAEARDSFAHISTAVDEAHVRDWSRAFVDVLQAFGKRVGGDSDRIQGLADECKAAADAFQSMSESLLNAIQAAFVSTERQPI